MSNKNSGHSGEPGDLGYNGFLVSLFYLARIDVECISDPNLIIIFKNLLKKNAVTREKRVAELLRLLQDDEISYQDPNFIMVWLQLYPHIALDSSKSVRQLAHQTQATLFQKIGGREFSKYLKTSIPLMLQSLYDDKSIASTTYKALLLSFNNDQERVDTKLWVIFHEQIVNYCCALIVQESPSSITDERYETSDDVLLKYDRAVNGAIQMLLKTITLSNKDELLFSDSAMTDLQKILSHEAFWDRLLTCTHGPTINVQLMKSYMQLLKCLFALNSGQILLPFTSRLNDLRGLYKLVSKKFIKCVKLVPPNLESYTSRIVYSSVILQFWDTLGALTAFTSLESATKKSLKIKKNFWQIGGSKSYSRFKEYLKLGPCQSDPVYYLIVKSFFVALAEQKIESDEDFSFLDFSSSKDAKNIIEKILLPEFSSIRGVNAANFRKNAADLICTVFGQFQLKASTAEPLIKNIVFTILDGLTSPARANEKQILADSLTELAKFVSDQELSVNDLIGELVGSIGSKPFIVDSHEFQHSASQIISSFVQLLSAIPNGSQNLDDLLTEILDKIAELYEPEELSEAFKSLLSTLKFSKSNDALLDFAGTLPGFITKEFVELPLQVFEALLKANSVSDQKELVEDFFTKLSEESSPHLAELFLILKRHDAIDTANLEHSNPEFHEYVLSLSRKATRSQSEEQVVYSYLNNSEALSNVFSSSLNDEVSQIKLIERISRKELPLESTSELGSSGETLIKTALNTIKSQLSQDFLTLIESKELVKSSIFQHISQSHFADDLRELAEFISKHESLLPLTEIRTELESSLNKIDLSMISLANPLAQNIHLVKSPESSSCELNELILRFGNFLLQYLSASGSTSPDVVITLGLCGQYTQDYAFLLSVDKPSNQILELQSKLNAVLLKEFVSTEMITGLLNGDLNEGTSPIFNSLNDKISGKPSYLATQFYNARLLVPLFTQVFESMSLSDFERLGIQYTRLANSPLKLAILLCSAIKFIGVSKSLDRIRNYVFGEVLGVKKTQILESGVIWITLAINFLRTDSDVPNYEVLPVHKWGMFMNHINSWLESDIAYEQEFLPMRSLLAIFFSFLIPITQSHLPDKAWSLAADLCLNNLATAQVESQDFELKLFSMKLFLVVNTFVDKAIMPSWDETKNSIIEELVDLMINKDIEENNLKANNQPVLLANELMERILKLTNIPKAFIVDKVDKFYDLLSTSKFLNLQRVATSILHKYILESQQDFVIEFLLKNTNLSDSSENLSNDIKLPSPLLTNIREQQFEEALDNKDYASAMKFLWSWILLLDHFKDTTYTIKAEYINQIKQNNAIETLLDLVFREVDVSDNKFLKRLVVTPLEKQLKATPENCLIQNYDIKTGCIGESTSFEIQFLLVHLYYLSFDYLGSFVQNWFNEIRDLQLKNRVEKFSVRYVSPILISKMLADVESQKNKLVERDDNLTIKVNKVINEIKSVYVIDEQTMEMVVKIPETFPLSNVSVEGPLRLGVKENQWKAWLLASQRVISLTNGSIIDCIELFNKNVNLHFSGFEECAICYSILHQDHSLPSKTCPTCLNKFHSACLYKWFKSSGSSTCPLCRCAFNFKAARS